MDNRTNETIGAVATPLGRGGVGIVRISGPAAGQVLAALLHLPEQELAARQPRQLYLNRVYGRDGSLLDQALTVLMPGPHSYTGEDVAELQCHGGPKVVEAVLQQALVCGCRLATPGEFTLRAFLNGRLDLAQAEAVADLIEAKTPKGVGMAAGQLQGVLSAHINRMEEQITLLLAEITVGVDFPDDADAPDGAALLPGLLAILAEVERLCAQAPLGRIYREGVKAVLAGPVNAGKSSLLNALLGEERAIVSASPGTTRDLIEEYLDLDGVPLLLCDTAGLRQSEALCEPERIGIGKSRDALAASQLLLLTTDITEADAGLSALTPLLAETAGRSRLLLLNKADAATQTQIDLGMQAYLPHFPKEDILPVSAKTGLGLPALIAALRRKALADCDGEQGSQLVNNARHQQALLQAAGFLRQAAASLEEGLPVDLITIDLENAAQALAQISGKSVGEEVLDSIFSRFCLGK